MHLDVEIKLTSFGKLKPYFVKKLQDFNSSCCKYHQEMAKTKISFNNMLVVNSVHHGLQNSTCKCGLLSFCANLTIGTF
jgi:hypothetical protein